MLSFYPDTGIMDMPRRRFIVSPWGEYNEKSVKFQVKIMEKLTFSCDYSRVNADFFKNFGYFASVCCDNLS